MPSRCNTHQPCRVHRVAQMHDRAVIKCPHLLQSQARDAVVRMQSAEEASMSACLPVLCNNAAHLSVFSLDSTHMCMLVLSLSVKLLGSPMRAHLYVIVQQQSVLSF